MSTVAQRPRALLFDLGRVLVGYDWTPSLARIAARVDADRRGAPHDDPAARIAAWMLGPDGPHDAYCLGRIDDAGLLAAIHAHLDPDHRIDDAWLVRTWCDMFTAMPGALATVDTLRGQARLALVSNTNALHFGHLERSFGLRARFDHVALSHEVGSMKPQPGLYLDALGGVGAEPAEAWFVDDLLVNVEGARALGMRASLFESVAGMRRELQEMGFELED